MRRTPKRKEPTRPIPYRLGYLKPIKRIAVKSDPYLFPALRSFSDCNEHDAQAGHWFSIPATRENVLSLEALATPESIGEEYLEFRNEMMTFPTEWANGAENWCALERELMPHQRQFLELAHDKTGMFNGSEQGTGKTATAFVLAKSLGAKRVVALMPKSLPGEWMREQEKLWNKPHFEMIDLVNDTIAQRKRFAEEVLLNSILKTGKASVVMVNYEALEELVNHLVLWQPQILFIDESWRVKNPAAKTTIAAMYLAQNSTQRFCMSGTIIGNHVGDLYSQLYILNPSALQGMTYHDFLDRFATQEVVYTNQGTQMKPVGVSDPVGLMRMLEKYWYRATKTTCLKLPPKQYNVVNIPLSQECQKLYNAVKEQGMNALNPESMENLSLDGERIVRLRLHQIAGGFKPVPTGNLNKKGNEIYRVEPLHCAKIDWILQWAEDHVPYQSETRVIIWVKYNAEGERIRDILQKRYGKTSAVFAFQGTDKDELESWKTSFNAREIKGVQWFICQIQKMASGHNMQAGDHHLFFSNSFSLIFRSQAEDRSHRAGREPGEAVSYWDLIAIKTIDEDIFETLQRKQKLATRLTPATASDTMGEEDSEEEIAIDPYKDMDCPF